MTFAPEAIHPDRWPALCALLRPAVERVETVESLIDSLLDNTAQLWVKREGGDPIAVAVTELCNAPSGPIVRSRYLVGRGMVAWLDELIEAIGSHARIIGARGVQVEGRPGWKRALGAKGWKQTGVVMDWTFG